MASKAWRHVLVRGESLMDCSDEEAVRKAIEEDRQSVSKAREAWQNATGKEASDITFKRFLETLVQDISV